MALFLLWHILFEGRRRKLAENFSFQSFILCVLKWSESPNAYDDNTHSKFDSTTLIPLYALDVREIENFALLGISQMRRVMKHTFNFLQAFYCLNGKVQFNAVMYDFSILHAIACNMACPIWRNAKMWMSRVANKTDEIQIINSLLLKFRKIYIFNSQHIDRVHRGKHV